jgi:hypothetical protein
VTQQQQQQQHLVLVWKKWNFVSRRDCGLPLDLYGDMEQVQSSVERTLLWKQKGWQMQKFALVAGERLFE